MEEFEHTDEIEMNLEREECRESSAAHRS